MKAEFSPAPNQGVIENAVMKAMGLVTDLHNNHYGSQSNSA